MVLDNIKDKIKSVARAAPSAATAGLAGKLLTFLLVFVFANIGYVTGFPLIIYALFTQGVFIGVNWVGERIGGFIIPAAMFKFSIVITKYSTGFILNGLFVWWLIRKRRAAALLTGKVPFWNTFFGIIIKFAWLWLVFSFVFTSFYTGWTFGTDAEFPVTGCGIQRNVHNQLGLTPISCDMGEVNLRLERAATEAEFGAETKTGIIGRWSAVLMDETGLGRAFKSKDVTDETIVNIDAGSTLTDLRAPKLSYTSNNRLAETIKILANIEARNLFLNTFGDSKIKVKIEPSIADYQCKCGSVNCLPEDVNYPFDAINSRGDQPIVFENKNEIKNKWCSYPWTCNIDGLTVDDVVVTEINTFMLGSGFHQEVTCIRPGLSLSEDEFVDGDEVKFDGLGMPFYVDVDFSYDGIAAANKQLFVISKTVARQEEDPITALALSDYIISNSFNDGRVKLGIGTDTLYEFVTPTYNEDFSSDVIDLGVSFSANRYPGGYKAEVNKVTLWIQVLNDSFEFVCENNGIPKRNEITKNWTLTACEAGSRSGNFYYEGTDTTGSYHKFVMNRANAKALGAKTKLNLGEVANYDIKMFIPSKVLGGASYQGILIESEVEYTYTTRNDVVFRVTHDEFVEDIAPEDAMIIGSTQNE